jgi:uncharacterized phage protein (TIGR02220 family)
MSDAAMNWAYGQEIANPSAKFILVSLARQASRGDDNTGDHIAVPNMKRLERDIGLTKRAIRYCILSLETGGLLTLERTPGRAPVYRLAVGDIAPATDRLSDKKLRERTRGDSARRPSNPPPSSVPEPKSSWAVYDYATTIRIGPVLMNNNAAPEPSNPPPTWEIARCNQLHPRGFPDATGCTPRGFPDATGCTPRTSPDATHCTPPAPFAPDFAPEVVKDCSDTLASRARSLDINKEGKQKDLPLSPPAPIPEHQPQPPHLSGSSPTMHDVDDVYDYLNAKAGTAFRSRTNTGKATAGAALAKARILDYGKSELLRVIDRKTAEWGSDDAMRQYLRPATLFRSSNCENYIGQLDTPLNSNPGGKTNGTAHTPDAFTLNEQRKEQHRLKFEHLKSLFPGGKLPF